MMMNVLDRSGAAGSALMDEFYNRKLKARFEKMDKNFKTRSEKALRVQHFKKYGKPSADE